MYFPLDSNRVYRLPAPKAKLLPACRPASQATGRSKAARLGTVTLVL
jgi:hypothetical protein